MRFEIFFSLFQTINNVRRHMKLIKTISFSIFLVFNVHSVICITKAGQDRLFQTFGIMFKITKDLVTELTHFHVQSVWSLGGKMFKL